MVSGGLIITRNTRTCKCLPLLLILNFSRSKYTVMHFCFNSTLISPVCFVLQSGPGAGSGRVSGPSAAHANTDVGDDRSGHARGVGNRFRSWGFQLRHLKITVLVMFPTFSYNSQLDLTTTYLNYL